MDATIKGNSGKCLEMSQAKFFHSMAHSNDIYVPEKCATFTTNNAVKGMVFNIKHLTKSNISNLWR